MALPAPGETVRPPHRTRRVPIGDYGFLSDGEVSALVAPAGSIDWMCLPRFDSPSIFGRLLGRHAGSFRVAPADISVPADVRYLPGTMILETSWGTPSGWVIVRDCLLIGPWHHEDDRSRTYRRTPNDYEAEHILLRTIRCASGEVQTTMDCEPVFDYGRTHVRWEYTGESYHQAVARAEGSDVEVTLTSDMRLGFEGGQASARTLLKEGDVRFVALSWNGAPPPTTYQDAYRRQVWTAHHWQHWLARGQFPDHPWRSYLQRSALTLKGLTYSPTGAIAAAGTTSLPETPGGNRNYDYRFTWIRDATFALWGLYSLGFDWEAIDFFSFIADLVAGEDEIQIMYGIGGEKQLTETELDHLPGYADSRPVRIGNAAYGQKQHDVWGALLDSLFLHFKAANHLDNRIWPIIDTQVQQALKHWREPDAGIWEVRGELQHFTSSKIMCWVAVDRGARIARMSGEDDKAAEWELAAQEIKDDILAHGVDERGVFTQHYGTTALDASLLLAPLLRFLPPDDERIRKTVMAIADELTVHDLVLRYKVDEIDDGFSGEEGSFTICSFWLVSALCEIGEFERARRLCAKLLSFAGPLQLYAEEIDPHTGQHLGNFPQAFTHLALINAVLHVIRIEEEHQLFLTAEPAALNAGEVLGRDGDDGAGESGEAAVHTTTAHPDDVDDVTRPVAP
ncbi:GH15 family glucan-1,4-alpha-glucosidase [Friedmanniella endophytica]|uniref:Trehalase n=1 Tax=Microlunatus kandeliicorticis TaxID=1759536 RepID=A0A7W3P5E7_9ACTN|nr:glycoside hydrolase family 15 protein [Microlunatus kandeliicorticis]MBA8793891.1 GH15 family glucan-1,4-alpha-glucosidase [Microlunatus kandeliicorticis]